MNAIINKTEVQVAESKISSDSQDVFSACLEGHGTAVMFYDSTAQVGGLLHYLLPSAGDSDNSRPFQYADTGIEKTLFSMIDAGAEWDRMSIKISGAALMGNQEQDMLSKRNILAARKTFWRLGLFIQSLDIGGKQKRQVNFNVADGTVIVRSDAVERKL